MGRAHLPMAMPLWGKIVAAAGWSQAALAVTITAEAGVGVVRFRLPSGLGPAASATNYRQIFAFSRCDRAKFPTAALPC
jgi:hypothetical protein